MVGFQAPVESVDELFDEIDRCACCSGLEPCDLLLLLGRLAAWLCGSVLRGQRSRVSLSSLSCVQEQDWRDRVRGAQQGTTRWVARVEHDRPDEEHVQAQERRRSDEPLLKGVTGTHPPPPSSFLRPSHTLASSLCHLQRRERVSGEKGKQKKKTFKQMEEEEAARKVGAAASTKTTQVPIHHLPSLSLSLSRSLFAGRPLRGPRAPQIAALPQPLIAMPDTTILIQTALAAQLAV